MQAKTLTQNSWLLTRNSFPTRVIQATFRHAATPVINVINFLEWDVFKLLCSLRSLRCSFVRGFGLVERKNTWRSISFKEVWKTRMHFLACPFTQLSAQTVKLEQTTDLSEHKSGLRKKDSDSLVLFIHLPPVLYFKNWCYDLFCLILFSQAFDFRLAVVKVKDLVVFSLPSFGVW